MPLPARSMTAPSYPASPIPVTLAIAVAILLYLLLDRTVFGRALYLIGNNPRAANLAGIPGQALPASSPM